jgi:WD40 repeat protein
MSRSRPHQYIFFLAGCLLAALGSGLTGCGGAGTYLPPPPAPVMVSVSPASPQVLQGGSQPFLATVTGTTNTAVTWTVQEGTAGGSITAAGVYTAPSAAGTFHVVATSTADPSKSAIAQVTVPAVTVAINQAAVNMGTGESFAFTASAAGATNQGVTWSIQEGASGGMISGVGVYTAPNTFGMFHVVATSQWDPTKTAVAVVTVAPLAVTLFPSADVLGPAGVRQFSATVTGTLNTAVTWSVEESAGGSVTQNGYYTAPSASPGTFHVVVSSVKDSTKSATSTITAIASGFRPTGNMRDGRTGHTATRLQSGKLLVAGGDGCHFFSYYYGSCLLNSSETFDPATGTFSVSGTLAVRRVFHTATLLANGKVLVAGGGDASAELYNPADGTFASTGGMSVGRSSHTATLLANGMVVVVGGQSLSTFSSAEEYDPAKGTFAVKGSMATARTEHTATLLGNGKVLIVGGFDGTNPLASAELYDPAAGTFAVTGSMAEKRVGHTATVLPNGNVLVAGGSNGNSSVATAEIYDVNGGTFSPTGAMMAVRDSHVAVSLPDGKVLMAGGITGNTDFVAEVYDPVAGVFTQTGSMGTGRVVAAAAALLLPDGRVLVTGGSDLNSAEVYK